MRGAALPLFSLLLSSSTALSLPATSVPILETAQVPFGASSSSSHAPERYDGQQVWRLDWSGMDWAAKEVVQYAVEVGLTSSFFHVWLTTLVQSTLLMTDSGSRYLAVLCTQSRPPSESHPTRTFPHVPSRRVGFELPLVPLYP